MDSLETPHFIKTSGQDGLHILIPLAAELTHAEARSFAEVFARVVTRTHPDIATVARPLGERGEKVYVDFLQNGHGKTIAAPFSVRPRDGAPVSPPLSWREVGPRLDPRVFSVQTAVRRFRRRSEPMREVLTARTDVQGALEKTVATGQSGLREDFQWTPGRAFFRPQSQLKSARVRAPDRRKR